MEKCTMPISSCSEPPLIMLGYKDTNAHTIIDSNKKKELRLLDQVWCLVKLLVSTSISDLTRGVTFPFPFN